jgi:HD-GYP domain-containing protein (c-di-GMP phosphodiesterase class II)
MLYEDMHAMFLGMLHALTSAIDAKDSYTHGHTERVAKLSHMLAEAAGLDRETVERVYISGLVHDVGKIGVPESVLCKPGKLTDDEFGLIKMHPEIGARILQDIRQMQDLLPGVMHHHERWDGNGYPHGLAEKDIPLFGRLIGLADAFDAMISTRTYRSAMDLDTVLGEIRRCAGTQFDPELAEVFLQLDFQPFFHLLKKHQHEKAGQTVES